MYTIYYMDILNICQQNFKEINMNIGEKIRNLRVKNKLTQKELADKINKSTITIRKYESQSIVPPIDVINQLSNLFNIS
ncbi:helix-turn-helix domain-containing protein, partial [Terrisporobacter petrolearius]|uniref:helix-turn-helix domain-containing protein n=1 Tax=Terrisporobacter petrolearius TaxID=1460447 RepID=UPI003A7F2A2B